MTVSTRTRLMAGGAIVSFAAAAALLLYLGRFRLPAPDGPYPVGTCLLHVTDASRGGRELVAQVWYPAAQAGGARARYARWAELAPSHKYLALLQTNSWQNAAVSDQGAPYPVLIYGHRWGGERTQNTALAEELASQGFVVAAVDHPGNSSRVQLLNGSVVRGTEDMDGPEPDSAAARIAFWNRTLEVWAADDEVALNRLALLSGTPGNRFSGRLETSRVGAFGHSFGGAAALRLCGRDPRVVAAVNLDGYTFGGLSERTARQAILILYEESTGQRRAPNSRPDTSMDGQLDHADQAAVEQSIRRFGGTEQVLPGMQHMDFSDLPLLPPFHRPGATGPIAPGQANAEVRQLVVQFFMQALRPVRVQDGPAPPPGAPPGAVSSGRSAPGN